jgi:hypothetical protein
MRARTSARDLSHLNEEPLGLPLGPRRARGKTEREIVRSILEALATGPRTLEELGHGLGFDVREDTRLHYILQAAARGGRVVCDADGRWSVIR